MSNKSLMVQKSSDNSSSENEFTLFLEWNDGSECSAVVKVDGKEHEFMATLMWICRGALMASSAERSVVYNSKGFHVCSYRK